MTEMMRRYRSMSDAGVRDLESYNSMIDGGEVEGERLPQVVVIIDELADLMLVAAKEVEESICRIAQMGRAAGIHLIIATQRPSADVITGLMKANIPSRIAFAVASSLESRIILDTQGAEKLVGKGDMLYFPLGTGKPQRVQGSFVSENEIDQITTFLKKTAGHGEYADDVIAMIEKEAAMCGQKKGGRGSDPDEFDGEGISGKSEKEMSKIRLIKMGFVFQQMYMMKKLCILDNVVLPGYQAKLKSRQAVNEDAENLMRRLDVLDIAERNITEVSGGQMQRACLCRALINDPKVLFADEPTGALNSKASGEVMKELVSANQRGTTVLMVTHSERVASVSERIIYLVDGNIQGELFLGKLNDIQETSLRERKVKNWLEEMGW